MTTLERPVGVRTHVTASPSGPASPAPARPVGRHGRLVMGLAWIVTITTLEIITPAADPAAAIDPITMLLTLGLLGALLASLSGLATNHWSGFLASVVGGAVLAGGTAYCFAIGHSGGVLATQGVFGLALMGLGGRYLASAIGDGATD